MRVGFRSLTVRVVEGAVGVLDGLEVGMEGGIDAMEEQLAAGGALAVGEGLGGRERVGAGGVGRGVEDGERIDAGCGASPVSVGSGLVAVGGDGSVFIEGEGMDLGVVGLRVPGTGLRGRGGRKIGGREAGGPGKGGGDDRKGVEDGAGAVGLHFESEEAVDDLGGNELDGGVVFEEGDGDLGGVGESGMAVAGVGVAEVGAVEGIIFTALAGGGDGAAGRVPGTGLCVPGTGLRAQGTGICSWEVRLGVQGSCIVRHCVPPKNGHMAGSRKRDPDPMKKPHQFWRGLFGDTYPLDIRLGYGGGGGKENRVRS
jgi:hypothetical protein